MRRTNVHGNTRAHPTALRLLRPLVPVVAAPPLFWVLLSPLDVGAVGYLVGVGVGGGLACLAAESGR